MISQSHPDSEEGIILRIVKELCETLGIGTPPIDNVIWSNFLNNVLASSRNVQAIPCGRFLGPMLSAHYPMLVDRALVLREMMKGRLEPEDWRPLIASSLIFNIQLGKRRRWEKLVALLPMFLISAFFGAREIAYRFLNYSLLPTQIFDILAAVSFAVALILGALLVRRIDKRLASEADRTAAKILGKEAFLQVLRKIDAIRQSDLNLGKLSEWRDFPAFVPSLSSRIETVIES